GTAIAGCVPTDAELDHTAGLLILREGPPLPVWSTAVVRRCLSTSFPIQLILTAFSPGGWTVLPLDEFIDLTLPDGSPSGLRVQTFSLGDHFPRFIQGRGGPGSVVGLLVQDEKTGGRLVYAPGVEGLTPKLKDAAQDADCILIDGTFWDDDEPIRFGIGERSARERGYLPVGGTAGILAWLAGLPGAVQAQCRIRHTYPR